MNQQPAQAARPPRKLFGLLAEFDKPEQLVAAARRVHAAGYRKMDGYAPYPIEELWEALGHHHSPLPLMVLGGGIAGFLAGFGLQYWCSVVAYPFNVGGRPLNSWPAFIPVTFEVTVLFAAFTAVLGMLAVNGLPRPYHPVFNVPRFAAASSDGYFLCIGASDRHFDRQATERLLKDLDAVEVSEVER